MLPLLLHNCVRHRALEDYYIWETRGKQAKELMGDMLKSRLEAQQLAEKFGIQPVPRNAQVCAASRAEGWMAGV